MGERLAGRLIRTGGTVRLVYDNAYRAERTATPISVTLPLAKAELADRWVSPWLAGLLPENPAVLARWARTFHVSASSAFSMLSTPVGEDCAGAVRFVTGDRLADALSRQGDVEWLDEAGVATRLRDLQQDATAWLGADSAGQFSLAGAQTKTALLFDNGRWGVPTGSASTSHILKPAIAGLEDHHLNEHICLQAARLVGLRTVNTRVLTFEDQRAIVVERYDRSPQEAGWLRRTHQEDLCQATGNPPSRKYQNEGGPGSPSIVALLRRILPPIQAEAAVWDIFEAMTFNWLIAGTDAHAKNYSLLLAGRQVRLAPLYDIASALPYAALPIQKLRLAMKFGDSYLLDHRSESMWPKVASEFGLSRDAVTSRAKRLAAALPDAMKDATRQADVTAIGGTLPGRLLDAVASRVAACRRATGLVEA